MKKLIANLTFATALSCATLSVASAASAAEAFAPFYANYDVLASQYDVKDIAIFEFNEGGSSVTNSFFVPADSETLITNPFVENSPVTGAFLLGVTSNLASDDGTADQSHLVVFSNDKFASSAQDIAFGTLFPNTNETSIINALEVIGQDPPGGDVNSAENTLGNFQFGDAENSPNGSVTFQLGDPFQEVAFSGGQIIGNGVSFATPAPVAISAAPEPSTWLLMFAGIGGIGLMLRRAQKAMGFRFKDAISV